MNNPRLTELLEAHTDGRLTPETKAELETLLTNSAEARRQFWEEMALHGFTAEAAKLKWNGQRATVRKRSMFASLADYFQPQWRVAWATAIAAVIATVGIILQHRPERPQPLANSNPPTTNQTVANVQLVGVRAPVTVRRNGTELVTAENFILQAGDEIRLGSQAQTTVRYADATRFALSSGATVRLRGPDAHELELTSGQLQAQVTKQTEGRQFVLHTPLASVTVHGTTFDLNAAPQATRVDVSEGRVQVDHSHRDSSVELIGGEFAVALPERELVAGLQPSTASPPTLPRTRRDVTRQPFADASPWNTALGSGAQFRAIESQALDLAKHGAALLPARMDRPIFIAQPGDPVVSVIRRYGLDELTKLRLPAAALTDSRRLGNCTVIDAETGVAQELILAGRDQIGLAAMLCYTNDLHGSGIPPAQVGHSWSGMPLVAGVIREHELNSGIRHALAASVWHAGLSRNGPDGQPFVWPARHAPLETKLIAHMGATGNVHYGTLLAIPPDVDITQLGLGASGPAVELARALQNYGAYVTHSYGAAPAQGNWVQPHLTFFADGVADEQLRSLLPQISKLAPYLKVVSNNSEKTPGGGQR